MPRYLNDLDVFYDPSQQHSFSPGFDEGTVPAISQSLLSGSTANTGSIDTSAIDAYTQGVELTQLKRHDAGVVKIWSGEPGHVLMPAWYGEEGPSISRPFVDDEAAYLLDASAIIKSPIPLFPVLTFPIQAASEISGLGGALTYNTTTVRTNSGGRTQYRTDQDNLAVAMNGVIEPLTIRLQPSFYSADVPVEVNVVRGFVGQGNTDSNGNTDQVLTVDYYDVGAAQPPFIDAGQNVNQYEFLSTSSGVVTASLSDLSNPVTVYVAPEAPYGAFFDVRLVRNALPVASEDSNLVAALSPMTGSTDNYVTYDQRSATCGWYYDNTTATGTDSLVFGGMTY